MAKGKNRINKALGQAKHYQKLNKKYYVRMREAELRLEGYEENIASQFTAITSHYEGIICYLMETAGCSAVGVLEEDVAAWAEGKEYALKAEYDDNERLVWIPVVREVEDEQDVSEPEE